MAMSKGWVDAGRADALYDAIEAIAYLNEDYLSDDEVDRRCKEEANEAFLMVCKFFGIEEIAGR